MLALQGLALLLLLQAIGEALSHSFGWALPGPVIGLGILLLALQWSALREPVQAAATLLLSHLSLLFVPVGVGVIVHLELVARHGWALAMALVLSTWIGLAVTAVVLKALLKRSSAEKADD
jgi:holin-like protein